MKTYLKGWGGGNIPGPILEFRRTCFSTMKIRNASRRVVIFPPEISNLKIYAHIKSQGNKIQFLKKGANEKKIYIFHFFLFSFWYLRSWYM